MKKLIFALLALCLAGTACRDKEPNGEQEYPIEIPFTEYSLKDNSCQWKDLEQGKVVVINSYEKLKNYITCTDGGYSDIDFSTHTLLLAHGKAPSSVFNVNCNTLWQLSEQNYRMDVDLSLGNATVITDWEIPIIVNKLREECIIELIVTIK